MKINLQKNDPIKRQTEVSANDRGTECSPMSPPEAYNPPSSIKVDYEKCHEAIKHLIDEHQVLKKILTSFESMLKLVKANSAASYQLKDEINKTLENFKQDFGDHNKKEEKHLFPILASRFLEIGEHSKTKRPITPINVLENEHTEATQLIHEIQYIWAVVFKIKDPPTLNLFLKDFLIKSFKLIEITRLHIFREDDIVFSLAQKNLSKNELDTILKKLEQSPHQKKHTS